MKNLNPNITAFSQLLFCCKWLFMHLLILSLVLHILEKHTLNVYFYLFPEFNFHLEINGEENSNTPFSKWLTQYDILTRINFPTNYYNYSTLSDKYSEKDLYLSMK